MGMREVVDTLEGITEPYCRRNLHFAQSDAPVAPLALLAPLAPPLCIIIHPTS